LPSPLHGGRAVGRDRKRPGSVVPAGTWRRRSPRGAKRGARSDDEWDGGGARQEAGTRGDGLDEDERGREK